MTEPSLGPEDLPAIRARVPANVFSGQISTGVIIVTGPMEFLLDFVRSLPRPNAIVSRIVLPHAVMPQFIQALEKNIDLYRQRFGPIPGEESSRVGLVSRDFTGNPAVTEPLPPPASSAPAPHGFEQPSSQTNGDSSPAAESPSFGGPIDVHAGSPAPTPRSPDRNEERHHVDNRSAHVPSPQDIYDELKLRDELLSGAYANAVMIGHGPYEFSFDFITNFYPQSAVSSRVFMAAGHVPRLLESLKASWEQFRPKMQGDGGTQ